MAAPVLLSQYKMRKTKHSAPPKESEIAVDMLFMRAFRSEMAAFRAVAAATRAEADAKFHRIIMLHEEQHLRNKQSYDSAAITYEALEDLKRRFKPECLES